MQTRRAASDTEYKWQLWAQPQTSDLYHPLEDSVDIVGEEAESSKKPKIGWRATKCHQQHLIQLL